MSKVRANKTYGFVGFGGMPIMVREHDEWDAEDPFVAANPTFFDAVPEPAPKRPILSRKPAKGEGAGA